MIKIFVAIFLVFSSLATSLVYHSTQQSEINYSKGHRFFEKGKFNEAIPYYNRALAIKPRKIRALEELAYSYQWTKQYPSAIENFKKILVINPVNYKIMNSLAETYLWNKEFDGSEKITRRILSYKPEDMNARLRLADLLSWKGDYDGSIAEYKRALVHNPGDISVKIKLAAVYSWKKDYHEAEKIYREIIKRYPSEGRTYALLGQVLIWQHRNKEAMEYFAMALKYSKPGEAEVSYGNAMLDSGEIESARKIFASIIKNNPGNLDAQIGLADTYAYSRKFKEAIALYEEALKKDNSPKVRKKLGDVLSWDKQYDRAIKIYDDILADKDDPETRLQKARVLGWAKRYRQSLEEYRKVLEISYNKTAELEMQAKEAYWNSRIKRTINRYNQLIAKDPQNTEAIFDLSQVYSYQSMWDDAVKEYDRILSVYPSHFRAQEGREKISLLRNHISFEAGYEFLEQDSPSRDNDVRRSTYLSRFSIPLKDHLSMAVQYRYNRRVFADFSDVKENESRIKFTYLVNPSWWADAFYNYTSYNEHIKDMNTFGASINLRVWDMGYFSFMQERERLENNSTVIRNRQYRDNYKERLSLDINNRFKAGADYLYSSYSDGNFLHQPGLDMLYYFSLDPRRLSLKYRYFYQNFDRKQADYFAPKGFSTNSLALQWRHYLNKEEIFFGADNLYYDIGYEISCDSKGIVGNKFIGGINWDINKRLNLNISGSVTNSSASVYKDKNIVASLRYYF